jgi:hypothetical protein
MLERLQHAYLTPWTDYASMERLQRASTLALRLDSLFRALSWYQGNAQLEPGMHADEVAYWLRVFLGTQE